MINAKEIELFKNLSQFEFDKVFYDFHNNFKCFEISFFESCLTLLLRNTDTKKEILLRFFAVEIVRINFPLEVSINGLTMDNLYRGRFESNENLLEFNSNQKSFYYLEFYEGQIIDFFCEFIEIKIIQ